MEFGGNVEGQRLVRCVDRGAWMRRAGRACAAGEISSRPHAGGEKMMMPSRGRAEGRWSAHAGGEKMTMPSRGRAEGRWSGVPGWRDNAMR